MYRYSPTSNNRRTGEVPAHWRELNFYNELDNLPITPQIAPILVTENNEIDSFTRASISVLGPEETSNLDFALNQDRINVTAETYRNEQRQIEAILDMQHVPLTSLGESRVYRDAWYNYSENQGCFQPQTQPQELVDFRRSRSLTADESQNENGQIENAFDLSKKINLGVMVTNLHHHNVMYNPSFPQAYDNRYNQKLFVETDKLGEGDAFQTSSNSIFSEQYLLLDRGHSERIVQVLNGCVNIPDALKTNQNYSFVSRIVIKEPSDNESNNDENAVN